MGEKDLYDFWSNTHKVHYGMEWNREVASSILSEWQAKFSQEVATLVKEKQMHKKYQINAFSSSYLNDILATFSEYDVFSLSLSYLFVVSKNQNKQSFTTYFVTLFPRQIRNFEFSAKVLRQIEGVLLF